VRRGGGRGGRVLGARRFRGGVAARAGRFRAGDLWKGELVWPKIGRWSCVLGKKYRRPGIEFIQISSGPDHHVCGVTVDYDVECWGNNNREQSSNRNGPFVHVATGPRLTCAVRQDGSVDCWGGPKNISNKVGVNDGQKYERLSLGNEHLCALPTGGDLQCWGEIIAHRAHVIPLGFELATLAY